METLKKIRVQLEAWKTQGQVDRDLITVMSTYLSILEELPQVLLHLSEAEEEVRELNAEIEDLRDIRSHI